MRVGKRFALALLIYVTADFLDPAIPGVFFFDSDLLFVDTAIEKAHDAGLPLEIDAVEVPTCGAVPHGMHEIRPQPFPRAPVVPLGVRTRLVNHLARGSSSPSSEDH